MASSVFSKTSVVSCKNPSRVSYLDEKWPINNLFTAAFFAMAPACTVVL